MSIKIQGERPEKFRGMSGSVVIADIDNIWKFAGMVTLASDPKGILSFIPAEKIAFYLNKMVLMEMTGMLLPEQPGNLATRPNPLARGVGGACDRLDTTVQMPSKMLGNFDAISPNPVIPRKGLQE
ncbi:hypothetical protein NWF32_03265 [Pseudomonas qingdaonensis]|nr:hypothetical protein [Pseudomonas qingdaonensis]